MQLEHPTKPRRYKLGIAQVFALTFLVVTLLVGALFSGHLVSARRAVIARSEHLREAAALRIEEHITSDLGEASGVLEEVERAVRAEALDPRTPEAAEPALFSLLLEHPNLSEVSLTSSARWQITVYRGGAHPGLVTRIVRPEAGGFVATERSRAPDDTLGGGTTRTLEATDPTAHLTYATTMSSEFYGTAIWSDLHYAELDGALPESERRVVVTVQKAIEDRSRHPVGVVRVGLRATTVDAIAKVRVEEGNANDPHLVFLCDAEGRRLTRLSTDDRLAAMDDDLRVVTAPRTPELARALASPVLRRVSHEHPVESESFVVGRRTYLLTLRALDGTTGWIVAILVPEDHYTGDLRDLLDRTVAIDAVGALAALLGGIFVLVALRRGLGRLVATTARMRDFDFAAEARPSALRDVDQVVEALERTKTAMRALGKYVPVDLVRELYGSNVEPMLGGKLAVVTLMFTDIRGFTDVAEKLHPSELAEALGLYFDAMTTGVRDTGGTLDKFIGDGVMAMWNAPSPRDGHAALACRAALACDEATARLYASEAWRVLPPLVTRFGIHTGEVMIGHFGAPTRFSYTALGDAVNLASRLESLGKQYGVTRLTSDAVEEAARGLFEFRKLDRVAVKGKSRGVVVFELLGEAGVGRGPQIDAYEAALELYFAARFEDAASTLREFAERDPPSKVLLARCEAFLATPPPADWNGTWVAQSK